MIVLDSISVYERNGDGSDYNIRPVFKLYSPDRPKYSGLGWVYRKQYSCDSKIFTVFNEIKYILIISLNLVYLFELDIFVLFYYSLALFRNFGNVYCC